MSDIVERLRQLEVNELSTHPLGMLDEAANEIEQNRIDLEEYRLDVEQLRAVVEAADKLRNGIRAAGVKRMPELYLVVMAFDAARAALSGDKQ
jgi:hypothetical protein